MIKERVGNLHCFEIRICIDFVSDGVIGFLNSLARELGERTERREKGPRKRELLTWWKYFKIVLTASDAERAFLPI